jgi:hypothetical protein
MTQNLGWEAACYRDGILALLLGINMDVFRYRGCAGKFLGRRQVCHGGCMPGRTLVASGHSAMELKT